MSIHPTNRLTTTAIVIVNANANDYRPLYSTVLYCALHYSTVHYPQPSSPWLRGGWLGVCPRTLWRHWTGQVPPPPPTPPPNTQTHTNTHIHTYTTNHHPTHTHTPCLMWSYVLTVHRTINTDLTAPIFHFLTLLRTLPLTLPYAATL